jgi:hypothetical protein
VVDFKPPIPDSESAMNASQPIADDPEAVPAPQHLLRRRLVLYFMILAIVPLLIVMTFVLVRMQAQSEQQVINQASNR